MKTKVSNSTKKVFTTIMIILTVSITSIANAQGISAFIAMLSPAVNLTRTSLEAFNDMNTASVSDNNLEIEDWMSNDNYWTGNERDSQLSIENWMSNENYWGIDKSEQVSDSPLTVQSWMTSNSYWTGKDQAGVDTLAVENWMASNTYWGVR